MAGVTSIQASATTIGVERGTSCDESEQNPRLQGIEYATPADQLKSFDLGPLTIETFSPVTITDLENRTNISLKVSNSSSDRQVVEIPNAEQLFASRDRSGTLRPSWIWHISLVHDEPFPESGSYEFVVEGGSATSVDIYLSRDAEPGETEGKFEIPFDLPATGESVSIPIVLKSINGLWGPNGKRLPSSAEVSGVVRDASGKPVRDALVTAALLSGELPRWVKTNPYGMFTLPLVSEKGLTQIAGPRPLLPEPAWNLTIDVDGYRLWSIDGLKPEDGATLKCQVTLAETPSRTYEEAAVIDDTDNGVGFWDMAFFGGRDRVIAIPGLHPPGRGLPGNIVGFDLGGTVRWKVPVPDFCWQVSVSPRDDLAAIPCSDGMLRVVSADGELIHSQRISNSENSNSGVAFSPDGKRLATSSDNGILVLDTSTWETIWTDKVDSYRMTWSDTEAGLVSGAADAGITTSYSDDGKIRWRRASGYVPFVIQVDNSGRVMVGGKSRLVRLLDSSGNEIIRREVAHTVMRTRQNRSAADDGSLRVVSTFNGLIYGLDFDGALLWQRWLPLKIEPDPSGGMMERVPGPGHGATYVTPDGSFVLIGTRGQQVVLLNSEGTKLWESESYPFRPGFADGAGFHPSANSVLASDDGEVLLAGYSDATIRIFRRSN